MLLRHLDGHRYNGNNSKANGVSRGDCILIMFVLFISLFLRGNGKWSWRRAFQFSRGMQLDNSQSKNVCLGSFSFISLGTYPTHTHTHTHTHTQRFWLFFPYKNGSYHIYFPAFSFYHRKIPPNNLVFM